MANISNINDFFVVDSAGLKAAVGADLANGNGSPYVGTDFTVVGRDASSPVANLWLSNFTHKSYILISDNSSNFIIRDSAAGNRLTIDTDGNSTFAGNVGIGITPSASFSGIEVLQIGGGMTLYGGSGDRATMASNLIVNTGTAFEYVINGLAGRFSIEDGYMIWGTAPTGTAGQVATVTTRMTLMNDGRVGIGVTPSYANVPLHTKNIGGGNSFNIFEGIGNAWVFGENDDTGTKYCQVAGRYGHHSGINVDLSGDVGIGTTSPNYKLQVEGTASKIFNVTNTSTYSRMLLTGASGTGGDLIFSEASTGTAQFGIYSSGAQATSTLGIYPNDGSSPAILVKQNGDVGIGTSSPSTELQVESTNPIITLQRNNNGNAGGAVQFRGSDSVVDWQMGTNQVVGLGLEFNFQNSNKVYIETGGNVGIGITSPVTKLHVQHPTRINDVYGLVLIENTNTGSGGPTNSAVNVKSKYGTSQFMQWENYGLRIGSRVLANSGTGDVIFTAGADSEKMRITSGGNVLFGTDNSSTTAGAGVKINTGTNAETVAIVSANFTAGAEAYNMYSTSAGAWRFYVDWSGVIHATSTSISALSDITLKENIKPLETGLDEVMKLQPRRFDWKNGDGKNIAGFVAQEVEEILPDLVGDYKYTDKETKKSLAMGNMIPTLVKAIQELKAEIEILKNK